MTIDNQVIITDERALLCAKMEELKQRIEAAERREAAAVRQLQVLNQLRQRDRNLLDAMTDANVRKDAEMARLKRRHNSELLRVKRQTIIDNIVCASLGFVGAAMIMLLAYMKIRGVW